MSSPFDRYIQKGLQHESKEQRMIEQSGTEHQDIPPKPGDPQGPSEFERALETLINQYSQENESGTPDFILAGYLVGCLAAYNKAIVQRSHWRGESVEIPPVQAGKHQFPSKTVKLVAYSERGERNEIGEAEIAVTPGEVYSDEDVVEVVAELKKAEPATAELPAQRPTPYRRGPGDNG